MAFRVVVRPLALRDLDETALYIAAQGNPERAARWRDEAFDRIDELAEMPTRHARCPESNELGVELRQFHHHSHRVIFRVVGDTVEVLRVYHAARRDLRSEDLP